MSQKPFGIPAKSLGSVGIHVDDEVRSESF